MIIKPYLPLHRARVGEIWIRSHLEGFRNVAPDDAIEAKLQEILRDPPDFTSDPDVRMHVLWGKGYVWGFVGVRPSRDDGAGADVGELWMLYLDPRVRRQGWGRQLLHFGESRLRELSFKAATLWVLSTAAPARRLYESEHWVYEKGSSKNDRLAVYEVCLVRYRKEL
jgi:ribosomal protein S18 acetylase RimI-like enzyme